MLNCQTRSSYHAHGPYTGPLSGDEEEEEELEEQQGDGGDADDDDDGDIDLQVHGEASIGTSTQNRWALLTQGLLGRARANRAMMRVSMQSSKLT